MSLNKSDSPDAFDLFFNRILQLLAVRYDDDWCLFEEFLNDCYIEICTLGADDGEEHDEEYYKNVVASSEYFELRCEYDAKGEVCNYNVHFPDRVLSLTQFARQILDQLIVTKDLMVEHA